MVSLALYGWPLVVVILFMKLPVPNAAAISVVAGYLLLPSQGGFDLPMVPAYDKALAIGLPVFLMALVRSRALAGPAGGVQTPDYQIGGWLPRTPLLAACCAALVISPFFTTLTNGDTLVYNNVVKRGIGSYEAASLALDVCIGLLPFFVARKYLGHPREQKMLLGVLIVAGLLYSLPTLYEVRMSPQLNNMVYGYFPHSWAQHLRDGGYRPIVFLEHGLRLGIFLAMCLLAVLGYMRSGTGKSPALLWGAALWLLMTLVLSKCLGAFLITLAVAPVILLVGVRMQLLVAAILAAIVLTYPLMRGAGLVPTQTITQGISAISNAERVGSLTFRFRNEDRLLEKANQRPLFGWGRFGRSRVYDERGRDISITDGAWIIIFGESGWIGYLARFGLLTLPVILYGFRRKDETSMASSVLCLILTANLLDLLPNSSLSPVTWLLAGSVAGRLEVRRSADPRDGEVPAAAPVRSSPYRRELGRRGAARGRQAGDGAQPARTFRRESPRSGPRI